MALETRLALPDDTSAWNGKLRSVAKRGGVKWIKFWEDFTEHGISSKKCIAYSGLFLFSSCLNRWTRLLSTTMLCLSFCTWLDSFLCVNPARFAALCSLLLCFWYVTTVSATASYGIVQKKSVKVRTVTSVKMFLCKVRNFPLLTLGGHCMIFLCKN